MPKRRNLIAAVRAQATTLDQPGVYGGHVDYGFLASANPLTAAQAVPVVWACVNVLAQAVARCRWRVVGIDGLEVENLRGDMRPVRAGRDMTQMEKWRLVVERLMLDGNAYLYQTGGTGVYDCAVSGTVTREGRNRRLRTYRLIDAHGMEIERNESTVIAIHGPGYNGLASPSPIRTAATATLRLIQAASSQQESTMRVGAQGRAVLVQGDALFNAPKQRRDEIAKSISEAYAGARSRGNIPVLPSGVAPAQMGGISPADLQVIELLQYTVVDICRVFGVPPRQVFHYEQRLRVTGFEGQAVDWQRQSVEPLCDLIADAMTARLQAGQRRYVLDSSLLALGTYSEQVTAHAAAVAGGILTPNEVRAEMGRPPLEGGDELRAAAGTPGTGSDEPPDDEPPDDEPPDDAPDTEEDED